MQSSKNPNYLTFMNVFNVITQFLLGAIAIAAIMFANQIPTSNLVNNSLRQHIYLCVIGYIILMAQAILSFSPFTGWSNTLMYQDKRNLHWIMQILGATLAIAGSSVRISALSSHFTSGHGAFGIIALAFTCLSLIGGVVNLFSSNINMNQNVIKVCHSLFGCITISCAFLTLILAFDKVQFRGPYGNVNANLMIAFTVFALVGTLLAACSNLLKRIR